MNEWEMVDDCLAGITAMSAFEVREALDELAQHHLIEFDESGARFRLTAYGLARARKENRARLAQAHHRRGKT